MDDLISRQAAIDALMENKRKVKQLYGDGFAMDCIYPHGIIHIWNRYHTFTISSDYQALILKLRKNNDRHNY